MNANSAPHTSGISERHPLLPKADSPAWWARQPWLCAWPLLSLGLAALLCWHVRAAASPAASELVRRVQVDIGNGSLQELVEVKVVNLLAKPKGDPRTYQHAVLPNGIQVLNVRDSGSVKAAFAVAVEAGSFDDPPDLPGLAHFCEHMLFLGTKKFPDPTGFDDFMSMNGGEDNAYTAPEVTVYYGELSKAVGGEVLDRFSDFFRAPLFNESFVLKEVHAIDSEHEKNVQNPSQQVVTALNSLADPRSPVARFHTGNTKTLIGGGADPVAALKEYFRSHYCPERMRLVTFGPKPLDEQLALAGKDFGTILQGDPVCAGPRPPGGGYASVEAFPPSRTAKWMVMKGSQPQAQLWLHFPLPDVSQDYRSQPLEYIDYVLGYQGPNSLSQVLQDNIGLVSSFSVSFDSASTGASAYMVATLTEAGRQHVELLLDVLFSYLATLRRSGVDQALYSTIADVEQLKWDWKEPQEPAASASDLAERLTRLPPGALLSGDELVVSPNATLVASLLAKLTPDRMNVAYVHPDPSSDDLFGSTQVQTLPYYGVQYTVRELADALPGAAPRWRSWLSGAVGREAVEVEITHKVKNAGLDTTLTPIPVPPRPIADVPKEIDLANMRAKRVEGSVEQQLYGPRPAKLIQMAAPFLGAKVLQGGGGAKPQQRAAPGGMPPEGQLSGMQQAPGQLRGGRPEVWYRSGWVTNSPKVAIQANLRPLRRPDEPEPSPLDEVRLMLYGRLLGQEMAPKMADLTATGVTYTISVSPEGLSFGFGGFAPMLPRLVSTVLEEFNRFNQNVTLTSPARFQRTVAELREDLSTYSEMPISYATWDRSLLLTRGAHAKRESLAVLGNVTLEAAARSAGELLLSRPLQLTALAMGNLEEREAREAVDKVWASVQVPEGLPIPSADGGAVERIVPVVNPTGPVEVRMLNPRPGDDNDAVVVSLIAGVGTVEKRAELGLLGQILRTLTYTELRTKRQLGYVVSAGSSMISNVQYISAVVQGNVLKADEVEAAIELVLQELMPRKLRELTDQDFASYVDSFRQELLQPPTGASDEVAHFWGPVQQGGACFGLQGELLQYLSSARLTRVRLEDVWADLAMPQEGVRKKVAVKYFAREVPARLEQQKLMEVASLQGLSANATALLLRERERAQVFDSADSAARARIVQAGGYHSSELRCRLEGNSAEEASRNIRSAFLSDGFGFGFLGPH